MDINKTIEINRAYKKESENKFEQSKEIITSLIYLIVPLTMAILGLKIGVESSTVYFSIFGSAIAYVVYLFKITNNKKIMYLSDFMIRTYISMLIFLSILLMLSFILSNNTIYILITQYAKVDLNHPVLNCIRISVIAWCVSTVFYISFSLIMNNLMVIRKSNKNWQNMYTMITGYVRGTIVDLDKHKEEINKNIMWNSILKDIHDNFNNLNEFATTTFSEKEISEKELIETSDEIIKLLNSVQQVKNSFNIK